MSLKMQRSLAGFLLLVIGGLASLLAEHESQAANQGDFSSRNAGAALIIDADISMDEDELVTFVESVNAVSGTNDDGLIMTGLVMANVKHVLNVREEPSENSERIGKMYADCGGMILDRQDGWTLLRSGNLTGWCSDEYLVFGQDAEEMAAGVGVTTATVVSGGLRVRQEPGLEGKVLGILDEGDALEVIEDYEDGDEWVTIDYEGSNGYVSAAYVTVEFVVDTGETMQEIADREAAEKAARKEKYRDLGSYTADVDDLTLLAALIYCEAGNQPEDGKIAVGAVVMNRLNCASYPDTLRGVIGASGQFSPVASGFLAKVLSRNKIPQSCYDAAARAMAGETTVGSAMHFRRVGKHDGIIIGDHVFW